MSKNILIFSDGTGQAGGISPDQRLSNIYKLYRATRVGPDNSIDPSKQIAFYDPGLGTASDAGNIPLRLLASLRKFASSATGTGLGNNVVDCYEAILKHYEPGDRIFLFGFSRGAYTARSVAGVLALCGLPAQTPGGGPVPRYGRGLRAIGQEAVHKVYEHGSGRSRSKYRPERLELARRFREKYASGTPEGTNAAPYFIGVFDTVAALGASGIKWFLMNIVVLLGLLTIPAAAAGAGALLYDLPFLTTFIYATVAVVAIAAYKIAKARLKVIKQYPTPRQFRWHWSGWRFKFYDTNLDRQVCFARHALAIDETRIAFRRVRWGQPSEDEPPPQVGVPERFQQVWFAGNHSDIGGSYAEDESRLSDIALEWMVEQISALPHPVLIDRSKLHTFPDPGAMQHCEVESTLELYPPWIPSRLRFGWGAAPRFEASGAPYHPSVWERLKLPQVSQCGRLGPYRPLALSKDPALAPYFEKPIEGPGTS